MDIIKFSKERPPNAPSVNESKVSPKDFEFFVIFEALGEITGCCKLNTSNPGAGSGISLP